MGYYVGEVEYKENIIDLYNIGVGKEVRNFLCVVIIL